MAPVLSYITFPASDNFKTEEAQVKSAIEEITNTDGLISSYHGLQVEQEGGKFGYLISTWESPEKLNAFREKSGDKFNSLIAGLSTGEIQRYEFVAIKNIPEPALQSKTVELAIGKPRGAASIEPLKQVTFEMCDATEAGGHPSAVGESTDGSGILLFAGGWESVEEHWAFTKSAENIQSLLGGITTHCDLNLTHAKLKQRGA
ncbi:hypothetical protein GYMLUDRAFT_262438 [Collybiopsis luxurians FD-317 M1]|uniref:ABM domain-containing protein n=1 Tax=Collybiopsis luxurians FD-317 M1 TaxID=944289 RepID=A0A0D0B5J6_9AGAR|nr:hypothetical protein GYMLUDRAFT_262438 [Collybiopsis luxurians FD-317 M1]